MSVIPPRLFRAAAVLGALFLALWPARPLSAEVDDDARIRNREGLTRAQQGDLTGALKAFEEACRLNPFNDVALTNLACAHNNLGVYWVQHQKFSAAIPHFEAAKAQKPEDLQIRLNLLSALISLRDAEGVDREARQILLLRPEDPEILLKIAHAYERMEESEAAQQLLERLLERHPEAEQARLFLGRLYFQAGNYREARFHLNRLLENPTTALKSQARELIARLEREESVETEFDREESVHFTLTYQTLFPRDFARDLLDQLETAYQKVGEMLDCYPSQRAQVLIYAPGDFRKVKRLPGWAGGMYDGKIRLPVHPGTAQAERLRAGVFHEYAHHLVFLLTAGNCPTWLNEGIAQFVEGADPERARQILAGMTPSPLKLLEGPFTDITDRRQAEQRYAESLLAASLLVEERGLPAVQELLTHLGRRMTMEEALPQIFSLSLPEMDARLRTLVD